jgi:membrane associated rhomboid family serine protease
MYSRSSFLGSIPPVVKNLLIINVLVFLASSIFQSSLGINLNDIAGLHFFMSEKFNPAQLVTYMFLHANLSHIFFNMFAVYMFGRVLEQVWGPKRFLTFYLVTGIGAAVMQQIVQYIELKPFLDAVEFYKTNPSHEDLVVLLRDYLRPATLEMAQNAQAFTRSYDQIVASNPQGAITLSLEFVQQFRIDYLNAFTTIGASGAVFGILLAFGMLFPNTQLMLLFPPIPIKAKYFVMIYGVMELFYGVGNFKADNVAHWAHLGGMLFGFFMIRYWRRKGIY